MNSKTILWLTSSAMLIGLPLLGAAFITADIRYYLEFPPLTRYVTPAPFNAAVFGAFAIVQILMLIGILWLLRCGLRRCRSAAPPHIQRHTFPPWGWLGAFVMVVGWTLAWTRFPWFAKMQVHTFCLPWLGYILLVNALCVKRTGTSLLTGRPAHFLLLWPVSAIFWWFFEYLNRYVQNWYYLGVEDFSPLAYIFHASLSFSTVLPSVLSTHYFLQTFSVFNFGLNHLTKFKLFDNRAVACVTLLLSAISLILIGRFPHFLYPLVWVSPLLVITSLQTLGRSTTIFTALSQGDWRAVISAAAATLVCGFFWELWNYHSLARWEYAAPFVDRYPIFAMPLLGYGSYLLFGLECLLIGRLVIKDWK